MSPQQLIAHYRITDKLGEGGMGEVWRASDTKLNRDVAIKVLPPSLAADPARMQRFEREAQVLASLNHPNIAAIYGIEQGAIVMELVEGEDLKGPVPVEIALDYARQIAAGLEAAHEKGIVHRDLKPANIKITSGRTVKLLDFGLAKATDHATTGANASPTMSPTLSMQMTQSGMILGTAAYMSPEQARGKSVDKRADIWAFGVVLYELITGSMLFGGGETVSDSLAAVITKEPDLSAVPEGLRLLLKACLEKDPRNRLRDIGDWQRLLLSPSPKKSGRPARAWQPWTAAAVLALAGLIAGLQLGQRSIPPAAPSLRVSIATPELGDLSGAEISPDGSAIVAVGARRDLILRRLNSPEWIPLKGTDGASAPFWSPDSQSIGFFQTLTSPSRIMKMRLPDGAPELVREISSYQRRASWSLDGQILSGVGGGLEIGSASGRPATTLLTNSAGDPLRFVSTPDFLPDGTHFLFAAYDPKAGESAEGGHGIYLGGWHDGRWMRRPVKLKAGSGGARYSRLLGGSILFIRGDDLYAQRLNTTEARLEGDARLIVSGVGSTAVGSLFSVSSGGILAWVTGTSRGGRLTWFDRKGNAQGVTGPPENWDVIAISPDERHVAATLSHSDVHELRVLEAGKNGFLRLHPSASNRLLDGCAWLPGSNELLYTEETERGWVLMQQSAAGGGARELGPLPDKYVRGISADGRQVLVADNRHLTVLPLPPPNGVAPNRTRGDEIFGALSPDGKWIAYVSNSQNQVFARPLTASSTPRQLSPAATAPGSRPSYTVWRGDGKEILYAMNDQVWSVAVDLAHERFGSPVALFSVRFPAGSIVSNKLAVTRDGSRILAIVAQDEARVNAIQLMTDWSTLIRQP
jgi:serine/threonine-protein kinase